MNTNAKTTANEFGNKWNLPCLLAERADVCFKKALVTWDLLKEKEGDDLFFMRAQFHKLIEEGSKNMRRLFFWVAEICANDFHVTQSYPDIKRTLDNSFSLTQLEFVIECWLINSPLRVEYKESFRDIDNTSLFDNFDVAHDCYLKAVEVAQYINEVLIERTHDFIRQLEAVQPRCLWFFTNDEGHLITFTRKAR